MLVKSLKLFYDSFLISNKFLFLKFIVPYQNNFLVDNFQESGIVLDPILTP